MKFIKSTLVTAISLGAGLSTHAGVEKIEKGPYTITIDSEGEFGMPNYKYNFLIKSGKNILLQKESKSSINGWEVNEKAIFYNKDNDTLWVIYQQTQDGLDKKEIHLAKVSNGQLEEVTATFDPLQKSASLKLEDVPQGWDKAEATKVLQQAVGNPTSQETILDLDNQNIPITKDELKAPSPTKMRTKTEAAPIQNGKQNTSPTTKQGSSRSMEW